MANKVIKVPINAELQVIDKNSASVISKLKQSLQDLTAPKGSAFNGLTKPIEDYQKALTKLATTQLTSNNVETYAKAIQALKIKEEELQNAVNKATNELNNQQNAVKTDAVTKAEDTLKNLAKKYETTTEAIKKMNAAQLRVKGKELGFETSDDDVKSRAEAARVLTNYTNRLDKLKLSQQQEEHLLKIINDLLKTNSDAGKKAADTQDELNKEIAEWEQQSAANQIKDKIKYYTSFAFSIQVVRQQLHKMLQTYQDVDAALTNISMVSGISRQEMWANVGTFNDLARELGTTTNEALEASKLYYQQGLKTNEVLVLTEQSLKLAAIAETDAKTATNYLTTAINGFKLSAEEATMVTDTWAELAGKTAVDVEELAVGISKVASIAQSAGMELQATSAFLTQIIETTREAPETAGTALKTIIARFQELKTAPGALEDGVDANKVEAALKTAGVALRDVTGQFRDFDDVILELSSKWDDLDRNTQRYIATIAAGSRQQSRFIALVDDYDSLVQNMSYAYDSAGAASEQFNIYNEGLTASLNRLKASWEGLYLSFEQGGTIVSKTVELLSMLLDAGAKIGLIPTGILTALAAQVARGSLAFIQGEKAFGKYIESIKTGFSIFPRGINFIKNYFKTITQLINAKRGVAVATAKETTAEVAKTMAQNASNKATETAITLTKAQKAMTLGLIVAVVAAAAALIYHLATAEKRELEQKKELIQTLRSEAQERESAAQDLTNLVDKYKEATLNGGDLTDVQTELINQYPSLAGKIDLVNGKYEENIRLLEKEIALEKERAIIANAAATYKSLEVGYDEATFKSRDDFHDSSATGIHFSKVEGVYQAGESTITRYAYTRPNGNVEYVDDMGYAHLYTLDNEIDQDTVDTSTMELGAEFKWFIRFDNGSTEYFSSEEAYLERLQGIAQSYGQIWDEEGAQAKQSAADLSLVKSFISTSEIEYGDSFDNNALINELIAEALRTSGKLETDENGKLKNIEGAKDAFEAARATLANEWKVLEDVAHDLADTTFASFDDENQALEDWINGTLQLTPQQETDIIATFENTLGGQDSVLLSKIKERHDALQAEVSQMWTTFDFGIDPSQFVKPISDDKITVFVTNEIEPSIKGYWGRIQETWSLAAQRAFLQMVQDSNISPSQAKKIADSVSKIYELTGQFITSYDADSLMSQAMSSTTDALLKAVENDGTADEIGALTEEITSHFANLININDLSFDPLTNSISSLSSALADLHAATTDGLDLEGFLNTVADLTGALDDESYAVIQSGVDFDLLSGKVILNEKATKALAIAKMNQTKAELLAAKSVLEHELATLEDASASETNVELQDDVGVSVTASANDALDAASAWQYLAKVMEAIEREDWAAAAAVKREEAQHLESSAETRVADIQAQGDKVDIEEQKKNIKAQIAFVDGVITAIDNFDWSTWKKGGSGKSTAAKTDANKEYINSLKAVADAQREAAKSAEEAAKAEIKAIQAALTKQKALLKEKLDAEKEAFDKEQELAKLGLEHVRDTLEKQREEHEKTAEEAQERATKELDYARKAAELRIEAIQAQIDAIDEEADAEDRLLELQKARDEYERARTSKTRLVLTKGAGWIFKTDNAQIKDAAENLQEAERDYQKSLLEAQIAEIEKANQQLDILAEYSGMTLSEIAEMNQQLAYYGNQLVNGDFENFVGQFGSVSTDPTTGQNAVTFAGALAEAINKNTALEEWNEVNGPKLDLVNEQLERVSQTAEELLRNTTEWQKQLDDYYELWSSDPDAAIAGIDEFINAQTSRAENIEKFNTEIESIEQTISDWDEIIELLGLSTEEIKAASELAAKYDSLTWDQMQKDSELYKKMYAQVEDIAELFSLANEKEEFYESEQNRLEGKGAISGVKTVDVGISQDEVDAIIASGKMTGEEISTYQREVELLNFLFAGAKPEEEALKMAQKQKLDQLTETIEIMTKEVIAEIDYQDRLKQLFEQKVMESHGDTYNFGTINVESDANSIEQLVTDIRRLSPLTQHR